MKAIIRKKGKLYEIRIYNNGNLVDIIVVEKIRKKIKKGGYHDSMCKMWC